MVTGTTSPGMSLRDENTAATRRQAASELFTENGYAGTSLKEIANSARVTTGAMYHHFSDKKSLFTGVAIQIEEEMLEVIAAAVVAESDPWKQLRGGLDAMFNYALNPAVRRIAFIEAPMVLGVSQWREIEARYAYGAMRDMLEQLQQSGVVKQFPLGVLAPVLLAGLIEAVTLVGADSEASDTALSDARLVIDHLFESLRIS